MVVVSKCQTKATQEKKVNFVHSLRVPFIVVGEEAWWQQVEVAGAQEVERDGAGVQLAFSSPPFLSSLGPQPLGW